MANTQAISGAMKQAALSAVVDGKTLKGALYLSSSTVDGTTAAYTATGELAATGNYTAGGNSVPNSNTALLSTTTAYWTPSGVITWANLTSSGTFNAILIYSTTDANRSIGVFTFGDQSITSGNLTLSMPANAVGTALVRFA